MRMILGLRLEHVNDFETAHKQHVVPGTLTLHAYRCFYRGS
jgi:hypothetical protein